MTRYRCYLLDEIGRIGHVQAIDCADDDQARDRALELLRGHPALQSVELWDGERKIAVAA
jgi:hypothetical protein